MKIIEKIVLYISGIGLICLAMLIVTAPMFNETTYYGVLTCSLMAILITPAYALIVFELKKLAKSQKKGRKQ